MPRNTKKQKKVAAQPTPASLDRFAGSSEEEDEPDDHDDEVSVAEDEVPAIRVDYAADAEETDDSDDGSSDGERASNTQPKKRKHDAKEEVAADDNSDDDDASDVPEEATTGLAGAMARILGTQPAKTPSVVLSKTKTPLQRQAELEKKREKELKDKKLVNRERNLAALHIPLSVATSSSNALSASSSLQMELQQERAHRRIATRGVVALFNAIAQHQHGQGAPEEAATPTGKKDVGATKMTKSSFLDMIKSKAKAAAGADKSRNDSTKDNEDKKKGWSALRNDYMLDSKDADWDQDESSVEEAGEVDEEEPSPALAKRPKIRS